MRVNDDSDDSDGPRTEIDSAAVELLTDTEGFPLVVPADEDVTVMDLPYLVLDRIEANGGVTFPDDIPAPDERADMGVVHWDADGMPTRLELVDGRTVIFTADGGVSFVFDRDGERTTNLD